MRRYFNFLLGIVILLGLGCNKTVELNLVVTSVGDEESNTGPASIQVHGLMVDLVEEGIEHGHCYSTSPNPTLNDPHTTLGQITAPGVYTSLITRLNGGTAYYVRGYLMTQGTVHYGEEKIFRTRTGNNLLTLGMSDIRATQALAHGRVAHTEGINITRHGHCWATTISPTIEQNEATDKGRIDRPGAFTSEIANLLPATKYYIRAYMVVEGREPIYGFDHAFVTASSSE